MRSDKSSPAAQCNEETVNYGVALAQQSKHEFQQHSNQPGAH